MAEHDIVSAALAGTTTRDDLRVSLVRILDAAAENGVDLDQVFDAVGADELGSMAPFEHVPDASATELDE
ncbi:hypothetical protein [Haloarchaeobius sp. HME9146]|uniref:hypothetical protein n=1 Tax=Haloarchaeobius sp. HME9146 TaxID=2978732 RepID=UPI0021BE6324|nr:hypothetical protein [Haloarchaeobius sp. HME9146]MCT9095662.1 hypothetical protein [Haloarchaeobius sp. HME9146]